MNAAAIKTKKSNYYLPRVIFDLCIALVYDTIFILSYISSHFFYLKRRYLLSHVLNIKIIHADLGNWQPAGIMLTKLSK